MRFYREEEKKKKMIGKMMVNGRTLLRVLLSGEEGATSLDSCRFA